MSIKVSRPLVAMVEAPSGQGVQTPTCWGCSKPSPLRRLPRHGQPYSDAWTRWRLHAELLRQGQQPDSAGGQRSGSSGRRRIGGGVGILGQGAWPQAPGCSPDCSVSQSAGPSARCLRAQRRPLRHRSVHRGRQARDTDPSTTNDHGSVAPEVRTSTRPYPGEQQ